MTRTRPKTFCLKSEESSLLLLVCYFFPNRDLYTLVELYRRNFHKYPTYFLKNKKIISFRNKILIFRK